MAEIIGTAPAPPSLQLPPILEPFRARIEATQLPAVKLSRAEDATAGNPWASKFGGTPYRRQGDPWPAAPDGRSLVFLAQLNFAELPRLPQFPAAGILQFFIFNDDLYGADFTTCPPNLDAPQHTYRVLFHAEPLQDAQLLDTSVPACFDLGDETSLPHSVDTEIPLVGNLVNDVMHPSDRRFEEAVGVDLLDDSPAPDGGTLGDARYMALDKLSSATKVGGHARFTQSDPRQGSDPHIVLFESDSDESLQVMWGDCGVANFFIRPDDLERLDFSRVYYTWDCS